MTRERWLRGFRIAVACGFALAWAGVLCRGRDAWLVTAVVYYATPWLLRLMAGILALVTFKHWGVRAMAVTCAVVSLMEGWHSFRWDSLPAVPAEAPQVSVWNAGRALDQSTTAWAAMGEADISAVIECGTFNEHEWRRFTAATPDHEWRRFDTSTMLGVRGTILSHESLGVHALPSRPRFLATTRRADRDRGGCPFPTVDFPRPGAGGHPARRR